MENFTRRADAAAVGQDTTFHFRITSVNRANHFILCVAVLNLQSGQGHKGLYFRVKSQRQRSGFLPGPGPRSHINTLWLLFCTLAEALLHPNRAQINRLGTSSKSNNT